MHSNVSVLLYIYMKQSPAAPDSRSRGAIGRPSCESVSAGKSEALGRAPGSVDDASRHGWRHISVNPWYCLWRCIAAHRVGYLIYTVVYIDGVRTTVLSLYIYILNILIIINIYIMKACRKLMKAMSSSSEQTAPTVSCREGDSLTL